MRILLVTLHENLSFAITQVLNPANEYCAIVTDEVEPVKNFVKSVGGSENMVYPFHDLKECLENLYYDFVLCISDGRNAWEANKDFLKYKLPNDKYVNVCFSGGTCNGFINERTLRYYKLHAAEFEMFATGICYIGMGLDVTKFKYKLFNFGRSGNDLYYDYQTAKFALECAGGGIPIRYALIGLAPYSFHWDMSKSMGGFTHFQQYRAFKDLHNFWLPVEKFESIFTQNYLNYRLPDDSLDLNNVYFEKSAEKMNWYYQIAARDRVEVWNSRTYPETLKENVKIFDDYLTLCEKNNVRPIIFLITMTEGYKKHFKKQMLEEFYYIIHEAVKKHSSAIFIDGWKFQGFSDQDFRDTDHMNIYGAAKFSAILNNVIEELEAN